MTECRGDWKSGSTERNVQVVSDIEKKLGIQQLTNPTFDTVHYGLTILICMVETTLFRKTFSPLRCLHVYL